MCDFGVRAYTTSVTVYSSMVCLSLYHFWAHLAHTQMQCLFISWQLSMEQQSLSRLCDFSQLILCSGYLCQSFPWFPSLYFWWQCVRLGGMLKMEHRKVTRPPGQSSFRVQLLPCHSDSASDYYSIAATLASQSVHTHLSFLSHLIWSLCLPSSETPHCPPWPQAATLGGLKVATYFIIIFYLIGFYCQIKISDLINRNI